MRWKQTFLMVMLAVLLAGGLLPGRAAALAEDLRVDAIEVSQGIQDLDNSMPLIAKRRTVVRVYARNLPGATVNNVRARLKVYRVSGSSATLLGTLGASNNPIKIYGNGGSRMKLNDSFWFPIPKAWMTGQVRFTAEINYDNAVNDSNAANNTKTVTLQTYTADPLRLRMVPMHMHKSGSNVTFYCGPTCKDIYRNVLRYHPVETIDFRWDSDALKPVFHGLGDEWSTSKKDQGKMLARLAWRRAWTDTVFSSVHFFGMINPTFGNFGRGYRPGWAAIGTMNNSTGPVSTWFNYGGSIMAHELGHNKGLKHVNCNNSEAAGGDVDPNYPWPFPNCRLAGAGANGYLGLDVYYAAFGLDKPAVINNDPGDSAPRRGFPMMGYEDPQWISPWEYCKLMPVYGVPCTWSNNRPQIAESARTAEAEALPAAVQAQLDALDSAAEVAMISGIIDDTTAAVELNPIYKRTTITPGMRQIALENRLAAFENDPQARIETWEVVVRDAAGGELHRQEVPFNIPGHDGGDVTSLTDIVPLPAGTHSLQIWRNGQPVAQRTLSANAPMVGVTISGSTPLRPGDVLRWASSDADGDQLYHNVLYSPDNGASWLPIELDTPEQALTMTEELLADMPASQAGMLKIVVSDGFQTAEAVSPPAIQVSNHAPIAQITSPADTMRVTPGDMLELEGFATDLEDGVIAEAALVWSSDRDGTLGGGSTIELDTLSLGEHTITLTATDSAGLSHTASIRIAVAHPGDYLPVIMR